MEKRKQFQLQILSNKLIEYNTNLERLKSKQTELSNSIKNGISNNSININSNVNTLANLLDQKNTLESRMQGYKNEIMKIRSVHTRLQHEIKSLPGQLETNKKQELDIYNEEILNINGRTQETQQDYLNKLKSLEIDKFQLIEQLRDLENQLSMAQENISSIQENAHAYRKNTLFELQQKKQQKVAINTALDELNKTKELYNNNQNDVSNLLDSLIQLKTQIINSYYNNDTMNIMSVPNIKELLTEALLNTINTSGINNAELLNAIISYLDKQIQDARNQLTSISKKATRLDKNITTTSNHLQSKIQPISRAKIISYKDNYKNAKMYRIYLEQELSYLRTKLDSWDIEIIENAKIEYNQILDSLEAEKQRAQERLNIMTSRITIENEINKLNLADRIKQLENELSNTNNLIKQDNEEQLVLLEEINKQNANQNELDKINTQISNLIQAIEKINIDIKSLSF
jgi:chromosome segregation ATPase